MEKTVKSKNLFLKFLPKAASAVTFQNPPFSPGRDKRSENANKLRPHACGRGCYAPAISMIPAEARRKSKNGSFDSQEPTSPKISCMGQIKHKKKINKSKQPKELKRASSHKELKKQKSAVRKFFGGVKPGRKSDASADRPKLPDRAPSLGQIRRFSSGRDAFSNFDWTVHQIAPVESDHRNYYSDEERGRSDDDDEEEEEIIIPFSAPILVGGGVKLEPRKEINLWKRRTTVPPRPLRLNSMARSRELINTS